MTQVLGNKFGGFYVLVASSLEKAAQMLKSEGKEATLFNRPNSTDKEKMTEIAELNMKGRSIAIVFLCRNQELVSIHERTWEMDRILLLSNEEKGILFNLSSTTLVECPDGKSYWRLRDNEKRAGWDILLELDQAV